MGRLGVTSDQWAWSSVDSGWLGVGGLFVRAGALGTVGSAGTGAISGRGMRDTIGLGKGVVVLVVIVPAGTGTMSGKGMRETIGLGKGVEVLVVIVGVQGSLGLGCGEFVGLTTSRLFLGLFIETGGFGVITWGSPTCESRKKAFMLRLQC